MQKYVGDCSWWSTVMVLLLTLEPSTAAPSDHYYYGKFAVDKYLKDRRPLSAKVKREGPSSLVSSNAVSFGTGSGTASSFGTGSANNVASGLNQLYTICQFADLLGKSSRVGKGIQQTLSSPGNIDGVIDLISTGVIDNCRWLNTGAPGDASSGISNILGNVLNVGGPSTQHQQIRSQNQQQQGNPFDFIGSIFGVAPTTPASPLGNPNEIINLLFGGGSGHSNSRLSSGSQNDLFSSIFGSSSSSRSSNPSQSDLWTSIFDTSSASGGRSPGPGNILSFPSVGSNSNLFGNIFGGLTGARSQAAAPVVAQGDDFQRLINSFSIDNIFAMLGNAGASSKGK